MRNYAFEPDLVRKVRKSAGMTQQEFAVALGCAVVTVSRWENSGRSVDFSVLVALIRFAVDRSLRGPALDALGCALQDVFEGRVKVLFYD